MADSTGITVAGRTFRPVTSRPDGKIVFDQYNWISTALWCVDLSDAKTVQDVLAAVAKSGQTAALLAGLATEGDAPWTTEAATAAERFFAGPHDLADCIAMQRAILEVLPDFFPSVLGSWGSSMPASAEPVTPASISAIPPTAETPLASSVTSSAFSPSGSPTSSPA